MILKFNTSMMKTLFLVALIIACATARTLTQAPRALLGTWSNTGVSSGCGDIITYGDAHLVAGHDSTIHLSILSYSTYVLQDVVANGTLAADTTFSAVLFDSGDMQWDITLTNKDDSDSLVLKYPIHVEDIHCILDYSKKV